MIRFIQHWGFSENYDRDCRGSHMSQSLPLEQITSISDCGYSAIFQMYS